MGRNNLAAAWALAPQFGRLVPHKNRRHQAEEWDQKANEEPDHERTALDLADNAASKPKAKRNY